jgi:hypothetical protein
MKTMMSCGYDERRKMPLNVVEVGICKYGVGSVLIYLPFS